MRKILKTALFVLAGILLLSPLVAIWVVPRLWSGPCGVHCERHLDSISIGPRGISLKGFWIQSGNPSFERWNLKASVIHLEPRWLSLLAGKVFFEAVRAEGLRLRLEMGDGIAKGPREAPPEFHVGEFTTNGAVFEFHRHYHGRLGTLSFSDIDVKTGPIGTDPALVAEETKVALAARMEASGALKIDLRAQFFQPNPEMSMRLELKNQNLAEANKYFKPVDEMELKGTLLEAATELRWAKATLNTSAALSFEALASISTVGKKDQALPHSLVISSGGRLFTKKATRPTCRATQR